jgi:hypothetical protein
MRDKNIKPKMYVYGICISIIFRAYISQFGPLLCHSRSRQSVVGALMTLFAFICSHINLSYLIYLGLNKKNVLALLIIIFFIYQIASNINTTIIIKPTIYIYIFFIFR